MPMKKLDALQIGVEIFLIVVIQWKPKRPPCMFCQTNIPEVIICSLTQIL